MAGLPARIVEDPSELGHGAVDSARLLRESVVPWDIYYTARLISDRDVQLLRRYDKKDPDYQAKLLEEVRVRGVGRAARRDRGWGGGGARAAAAARTPPPAVLAAPPTTRRAPRTWRPFSRC